MKSLMKKSAGKDDVDMKSKKQVSALFKKGSTGGKKAEKSDTQPVYSRKPEKQKATKAHKLDGMKI